MVASPICRCRGWSCLKAVLCLIIGEIVFEVGEQKAELEEMSCVVVYYLLVYVPVSAAQRWCLPLRCFSIPGSDRTGMIVKFCKE
jgi:hypothetical protein